MSQSIRVEDGRVIIPGPGGESRIEFIINPDTGQTLVELRPPSSGKRTCVTFYNGSSRPLSIETHGKDDPADPGNQDVSFYTEIPGMGNDAKMFEWRWGEQWDGVLKLFFNLLVKGKVGFYGTTPVDKPVVTGGRVSEVLKNLLRALSSMGLIDDQTTL
jgi:hypothetical protein